MTLIIEDEPMVAEIIAGTLSGIDHLILKSYQDLIQVPIQTILNTRIVITDMHLEITRNALDVKNYTQNINPNIRYILMTGAEPEDTIIQQFDKVLYKPFLLKDLRDCCS